MQVQLLNFNQIDDQMTKQLIDNDHFSMEQNM